MRARDGFRPEGRDVVRMKKPHPCGNYLWLVTRLGADIGLTCQKCQRHVMLARSHLERASQRGHPQDFQDPLTGHERRREKGRLRAKPASCGKLDAVKRLTGPAPPWSCPNPATRRENPRIWSDTVSIKFRTALPRNLPFSVHTPMTELSKM